MAPTKNKKTKADSGSGTVQLKGNIYRLQYWVTQFNDEGKPIRVRAKPQRLGRKDEITLEQARILGDDFMASLTGTVPLDVTVAEFVRRVFIPDHVKRLKHSSQRHADYCLDHILKAWGERRLGSITSRDVQELLDHKSRLFSSKTVALLRAAISSLFTVAIGNQRYHRVNPAKGVHTPEVRPVKSLDALTDKQVEQLVAGLDELSRTGKSESIRHWAVVAKAVVLVGIFCGMGKAEILGLRYGCVNLTDGPIRRHGRLLQPGSLYVRENYCYKGSKIKRKKDDKVDRLNYFTTPKTTKRERVVPILPVVADALKVVMDAAQWQDPDDVIFVSSVRGVPLNDRNLERRIIKPVCEKFGFGWYSFHSARRTFASLTEQHDMSLSDRMYSLGHASGGMTQHYTKSDLERRRTGIEDMADHIFRPAPNQTVSPSHQTVEDTGNQTVKPLNPVPDQRGGESEHPTWGML
jgi:integrase